MKLCGLSFCVGKNNPAVDQLDLEPARKKPAKGEVSAVTSQPTAPAEMPTPLQLEARQSTKSLGVRSKKLPRSARSSLDDSALVPPMQAGRSAAPAAGAPMLGSLNSLGGTVYMQKLDEFMSSTKLYPESKFPGSKNLVKAILQQGLVHVTDGSKPAYMGYEQWLGANQPDIAGTLQAINAGRRLRPEFAVVTYSSDKLRTGYDATFVINKQNMRQTIQENAADLGISGDEASVDAFLDDLVHGRSLAFRDEVKLGILLGLGAQNSKNYAECQMLMDAFETEVKSQGREVGNEEYNAKHDEIDARLGRSTTRSKVADAAREMDLTMPRPWLGSVWDSAQTTRMDEDSSAETQHADAAMRERHAARLVTDSEASYADTMIQYLSDKLYLPLDES